MLKRNTLFQICSTLGISNSCMYLFTLMRNFQVVFKKKVGFSDSTCDISKHFCITQLSTCQKFNTSKFKLLAWHFPVLVKSPFCHLTIWLGHQKDSNAAKCFLNHLKKLNYATRLGLHMLFKLFAALKTKVESCIVKISNHYHQVLWKISKVAAKWGKILNSLIIIRT